MSVSLIIALRQGAGSDKRPYPIRIDNRKAVTGLGRDDGATLVGFSKPNTQRIELTVDAAIANPGSVEGLWPIFANGTGMFDWSLEVDSIRVVPSLAEEMAREVKQDG